MKWGRCRRALAVGLLLGSGLGAPAPLLAAPDIDAAVDALISTPFDSAGDAVGGAGLFAAGALGLVGDAVSLLDRNAYGGELLLRGILSTPLRRTALALSQTSTGALEGLRAEDLEPFPELPASYLEGDAGDVGARVDTLAAGLGAAGLAVVDGVLNPLLFLTHGIGLAGPAAELAAWQTDARDAWLGTAK